MADFKIISLIICLIVVKKSDASLMNCSSDADCPGGAIDKCEVCANFCHADCDRLDTITNGVLCIQNCDLSFCECQPGYFRTWDGKCVRRSECYRKQSRLSLSIPQLMFGYRSLSPMKNSRYESYNSL